MTDSWQSLHHYDVTISWGDVGSRPNFVQYWVRYFFRKKFHQIIAKIVRRCLWFTYGYGRIIIIYICIIFFFYLSNYFLNIEDCCWPLWNEVLWLWWRNYDCLITPYSVFMAQNPHQRQHWPCFLRKLVNKLPVSKKYNVKIRRGNYKCLTGS